MSPQLETQGPGSSRCGRPGVGVGGGVQPGLAGWPSFLGQEELRPGDRQAARVPADLCNEEHS